MFILAFLCMDCTSKKKASLTIAAAANMQFAITEIVRIFEEEHNVNCDVILGSSGKLTAQVIEGAPYDIFISADTIFPNKLLQKGSTFGDPVIYANGKLILWTLKEDLSPSLGILSTPQIEHIAIANPKTAPYGDAAVQILNNSNIMSKVEDKIVYGESIAQVNQFISTQAAEIGLTSKSVVHSKQMKGKGQWVDVDTTLYEPIPQAYVVLSNKQSSTANAQLFADFLGSNKAREVLLYFGYETPK